MGMNKSKSIKLLIIILLSVLPIFNHSLGTIYGNAQSSLYNPGAFVNEVALWNPDNIDPATNNEMQGGGIVQLAYEGLLSYTNNSLNSFSSSLAYSNYRIDSSGTIYTFQIRSGVTFTLQNGETTGQPFNAYVMQYSILRAIIMNVPQGPVHLSIDKWLKGADVFSNENSFNISKVKIFLALQSIKAISPYELQITLSHPFSGFINVLCTTGLDAISPKVIIDNEPSIYTTNISNTQFGMVPLTYFFPGMDNSSILENLGLPSNYDLANSGVVPNSPANVGSPNEYTWTKNHSAGTGPWILQSNIENSGATIIRNPNWWNKVTYPSQNGIETVIWKQVSDITSRLADLKVGQADSVDFSYSNLGQIVNTTTFYPLIPGIQTATFNTLKVDMIGFNMNPTIDKTIISESTASNYAKNAMNYTKLLQYTWNNGTGFKQYASPGNPFTSLLFREAFAYTFNYSSYIKNVYAGMGLRMQGVIPEGLIGAQTSLIADGYIPNFDLITAKSLFQKVGWEGNITVFYKSGSYSLESYQFLKNAIEGLNVGIFINIKTISSTNLINSSINSNVLYQIEWKGAYTDTNAYVTAFYGNSSQGGYFSVNEHYNNPYVSNLIASGASPTSNSIRSEIYGLMEKNATQDFPYIYLTQLRQVRIIRFWIHNLNAVNK